MHRAPRPLTVAALATVLLVTVLAVDLTYNRTFSLELQREDGWATISTTGEMQNTGPHPRMAPRILEAEPGDNLTFRLRVDNDMPFAYEEPFRVYHYGTLLAEGTLTADAGEFGNATFTLPARALMAPGPKAPPGEDGALHFVSLEVVVDDELLYGSFELQEATRS